MNKNIIVSCFALLSVLFGIMFLQYVSVGPNLLTETSTDEYINYLSAMNVFGIVTSVDFWNLSMWHFLYYQQGGNALINVFSAMSLVIFCTGLLIYNSYLDKLPKEYISLLFMIMGWAHVALAKVVLITDLPVRLVGPVLAVGFISLLYFSLIAFLVSISYVVWIKSK